MTSVDNLLPAKSCLWLESTNFSIPLKVLKAKIEAGFHKDNIRCGFLEDEFVISVAKTKDSLLNISVFRNRVNPNKKHDDGYALRFYVTVTGFDEEPQVSIMIDDVEKAEPVSVFKISKEILAKVGTTHHVFDVVVVIQMLEFKNVVDEKNVNKLRLDLRMSYLKQHLTEKEHQNLCCILKCSELEDFFTGRLPVMYTDAIFQTVVQMSKDNAKVAEYLQARYNGKHSKNPDEDLSNVLKYANLDDLKGRVPLYEGCKMFLLAHKIGLDCMKIIAADYLLRFLAQYPDSVLYILDMALLVHDEYVFDKAIFIFLNNFHKIIRSKKFEEYSNVSATVTRLIIHSARLWITKNDIYIPGWEQPAQPTTEL